MKKIGLTIPVYGLSWVTLNLLNSIKANSPLDRFLFIVIDNGSTQEESDDVFEWLCENIGDDGDFHFDYTETPLGFVKAVNKGIDVVLNRNLDYFFIMNNDTMVTSQWDIRLLDSLKKDNVGIVGGMTSPPDWREMNQGKKFIIKKERYNNIKDNLERFAITLRQNLDGMETEKDFLPFYCAGLKVSMVREIGKLDEDFNMGLFDDNDFCYRATQKGWKIILRKDCYIHHLHNSTFIEHFGMEKYFKWLTENKRIFIEKHGFDPWPELNNSAGNTKNVQKS